MRASLGNVLIPGTASGAWDAASAAITAEREAIESWLAQEPLPRVYGFTTLLGQLDTKLVSEVDQAALLTAHLIGARQSAPPEFVELATRCKLQQLSHGGSGIHPSTYSALRSSEPVAAPRGAWLSSYGSGDVVPAAWWIVNALPESARDSLKQGDLIALLNGNFYSTAVGVASSVAAIDALSGFLRHAARLSDYPSSSQRRGAALLSPRLANYFAERAAGREAVGAQQPVSLRDADAYLAPIVVAVDAVGEALDRRLGAASANPLFVFEAGDVRAESQSSFLDITLTLALTNLAQVLQLALRGTQRMIVHLTNHGTSASTDPDPQRVQPSKVAAAIVDRATFIGAQLPVQFSGSESEGIEDLRDLSLLTGSVVLELVALTREALALLESVSPATADDHEPFEALLSVFTGGAAVDITALTEAYATMRGPFFS